MRQIPEQLVVIDGMPADLTETTAAVARSRLSRAYTAVAAETRAADLFITVGRPPVGARLQPGPVPAPSRRPSADDELSVAERAARYPAGPPRFTFDQLVLPPHLRDALLSAVEAMRLRPKIFDEWGLRAVEPSPSTALNLHGPPGTGKSLAAHAIADRLRMPIITAGYAEIESKFHGDGPKNVQAIFEAAQRQRALLFIDEADSLLSHRLTNVSQGSDQAINSMRSQIVLSLDRFEGIVVFATNLVSNYDRAFQSRVRHFNFTLPDAEHRTEIWRRLLVPQLPRAADVDAVLLAGLTEGCSGREMKLALIAAAERVAIAGRDALGRADFEAAIDQIVAARAEVETAGGREATPQEREAIEQQLVVQGIIEAKVDRTPPPAEPADAPDR
ncbi:AAA family ATPase [Dactylosporangium vinaceum]|uniref:ATP-binding protein n=1 Tax=Dactylosporangium vinaceum TaxID=53362 RepID=A0ABV5MS57_9ACTN|nr:ATP-binding protein [Dactylosporangium vinaceum]UAC00229.1 AAA family ATPase [Dactylosporangium vinaceum]